MFLQFSMVWIILMIVVSLGFSSFAAVDLSTAVNVSGLSVNSNPTTGDTDWSGSASGANWSGTTVNTGSSCKPSYSKKTGELVLTNNSGAEKTLSFDYTVTLNDGSVSIDGASVSAGGSFKKALAHGESITIKSSSPGNAEKTTTVTLSNIKLEVQQVTVTFAPPTNGSYTVDGTPIESSTSMTNPSTKAYKLVATPAEKCIFVGWYLDGTLYSTAKTVDAAIFLNGGSVSAEFAVDPLYTQASVPSDSAYTKDELVSINSQFLHDSTDKLVLDNSMPKNQSAYSKKAQSQIKDHIDVQYVPSRSWSDSMSVAFSVTAGGDYVTGFQNSTAHMRVLSDVICIYAKENLSITFDYSGTMSGGKDNNAANFYTYITTKNYESTAITTVISNIKTGTLYQGTGSTDTIAVPKGNYLYILAEGYATNAQTTSSQHSVAFSYSASISNFQVSYNEKKDILTAGFRDNTGTALGSGKITVNDVQYSIGSNGNMADMELPDLASVVLKIGAAPSGYTHIGWKITPEGGKTTYVYEPTYSRTMQENCAVEALFVPSMTITMGANGYTDATYQPTNGAAYNGQYVARNADTTAFYTTLAEAFAGSDTVVLLAGATINGDWEIPAGKTFVIPFSMADRASTTPVSTASAIGSNYCKVTLNGNLTVNGTLLVDAQQYKHSGVAGGPLGHLSVASGKQITVNGTLYAYGAVTGSGSITTGSNAKIHEYVEFQDNRGVGQVYNIYQDRNNKRVFPFNTMFIKSIEIPVTYQSGAALTGHMAVTYDGTTSAVGIPIIGSSGALINNSSGSVTKYYDNAAGQFVFQINEDCTATTGSFSIDLTVTIAGITQTVSINSADYFIPLSAPFRFDVAGSLTLNGDYKFLPGSVMHVLEGGQLTIPSGKSAVFYRMNDYDTRGIHSGSTVQWGFGAKAYPCNPTRYKDITYAYSFTAANAGSAKLIVDGTLTVNGGLYVTNQLQTDTANGIVIRENGYNYLTGSGMIDMTNAQKNDITISEAMSASGTNDIAWASVTATPMKGLNADADNANDETQYVALSRVHYGVTNPKGMNVWVEDACFFGHQSEKTEAKEATCLENGNSEYYTCTKCKKFFSDAECTIPIDENSWIIPANGHSLTGIPAQEPTCTAAGNAAYWQCNNCGQFYSDANAEIQIEKDSWVREILPHEYNEETVAPSCMAMGCTTYTCTRCGDSYQVFSELVDHAWDENGVCTVCGFSQDDPGISYVSVTMANSLDMNFAFQVPEAAVLTDDCYVEFTRTKTGTAPQKVSYSQWKTTTINGNPYYYASYTGLAAKEMPDMVYAAVRDGEGNLLCAVRGDSIQKQAMRNLAQTQNDLAKTMVVDMLNYGAAAQTKFGYRTDNLANSQLTEAQKALASTYSPGDSTPINTGCNIIYMANVKLESNIQFMIGLQNVTDSMTAHIAFTDHYGKEKDVEVPLSSFSKDKTTEPITYVYTFDKTVIADARQPITITIKNSEGATVATITDSIANYAARAEDTSEYKKLYECIVKFADSAHAFLHPQQN